MRNFDKILAFVIVIILVIGTSFFIYTIWITPASKASTPRVVIDYEEKKKELNKNKEPLYIKVDSESDVTTSKNSNNETSKTNTRTETKKAENVSKQEAVVTKVTNYPDGWLENFNKQVTQLKQEYPSGYYWNSANNGQNGGVTKTPCNHKEDIYKCNTYEGKTTRVSGLGLGAQCAGFASMLSDRIFGKDAPVRIFYNYDEIRVGDQARINNNSHTVFILEKTDDYVIVAECNADYNTCVINWGRKITRNNLKGYYITRW